MSPTLFMVLLLPLSCFVGAVIIASMGKDGWGWFLAAGILCLSAIKIHG